MLISNGLYFWLFRQELGRLQEAFALRNLQDEICRRFVSRELMDKRVEEGRTWRSRADQEVFRVHR